MDIETLRHRLDDPTAAAQWLRTLGIVDPARAHTNLLAIATSGMTLDLVAEICDQLAERLPVCADPDMALNNLERFVAAARNRLGVGTLFQRDPASLRTLVQIFSTSQYLSDLLIADRESLDLLRLTEGQPLAPPRASRRTGRRGRGAGARSGRSRRSTAVQVSRNPPHRLRRHQPRTRLANHHAANFLRGRRRARGGVAGGVAQGRASSTARPCAPTASPASIVILAMGKLGGVELNYSSDIDVIFLYDEDGQTDGRRQISNAEFFSHLARECVRLLTKQTDLGAAYRVDLRLRPEGERGAMVSSAAAALRYYDTRGRTWERQAYIKARPAAGDLEFGDRFSRANAAVDLPALSEPRRHQRHQDTQAAN